MARPIRLEFPNALYHVMSRGNGEENIFIEINKSVPFLIISLTSWFIESERCYEFIF